jgi:hypothetical protein
LQRAESREQRAESTELRAESSKLSLVSLVQIGGVFEAGSFCVADGELGRADLSFGILETAPDRGACVTAVLGDDVVIQGKLRPVPGVALLFARKADDPFESFQTGFFR